MTGDDLPVELFPSQADWEAWLEEHHAAAPEVWVKFAKKGSGVQSVSYGEAVESALCFGWIDGQMKSLDEHFYVQRFTPRRRRSSWSKVNVEKATALIEAGRMRPAGLAEVERAKADGRWDAVYEPPSTITVPEDLGVRARREPEGAPGVRRARQPEPLPDPLPRPRREEARDAGAQDHAVRRTARRGPKAARLSAFRRSQRGESSHP